MDFNFKEGFKFFEKNCSSFLGSNSGAEYIEKIEKEIEELENNINSFKGFSTEATILKGDIAEFMHAGTFNINAAIKSSTSRAKVDRSHDFASVDISTNFGKDYGSKYYSTAEASAKAQSITYEQAFKEYQAKGGKLDFNNFLSERNKLGVSGTEAIYADQFRLISSDQYEIAKKWLEKKIAEESVKRPEQVERYKNSLDMLAKKITDDNGVSSIELTSEEAVQIAKVAKEGNFNASEFGIKTSEMIQFEYTLKESMKAGINAAIISLAIKLGPELYKTIEYILKEGNISKEKIKESGLQILDSGKEGFLRGSIAAAISISCKSGILGETLKNIDPTIIGVFSTLSINVIKGSYEIAIGKNTGVNLLNQTIQDTFVATSSILGGYISQSLIPVPVFGYLIGSFVGSIAGAFIYKVGQSATLSFCIDTGFTLFGLVEQDYTLPREILETIGIKNLDFDTFEFDTFKPESFDFQTFECNTFMPDSLDIKLLRRGVIGVTKISYI